MTRPSERRSVGGSLQRAARGSVLNLLGSTVAGLTTFVMAVVIARFSTQAEAGVFFSATSLFLIATSLGRLGTNTGLVYFISGAMARGERGMSRAYMRVASAPVVVVAALTSLTMFLGADQFAAWLSPVHEATFATYSRVMAFFVPMAAIANLMTAGTQGLGTMKVYSMLDQVLRSTLQLVLVTGALLVGGAAIVSASWAGAYLPFAVLAWLWWRMLQERLDPFAGPPKQASSRTFWKFSSPRAIAGLTQIAMQRLDIVLVGALAGLPAAAVYAAATRFLVLGQMAGRAISLSIQPLLGRALARADLDDARNLYQTCTAWLVVGTWPFYLLLMNFAPLVLAASYGGDYEIGGSALILLCGAMLLATACGTVDMVLNMAGRSLWNLMNALISFSVFLALDLWLIPKLGFMGAAIGWAVAITVANILPLIQVIGKPGIHPFGRATLLAMGVNLLLFGGVPWFAVHVFDIGATLVVIGVSAGLVGYLIFLMLARHVLQLSLLLGVLRRRRQPATSPPHAG